MSTDPLYQNEAPIEKVLSRLDGVKKQGTGFMSRCPAHDDRKASLSVSLGKDGETVVMKCFAGCDNRDIAKAAGFELRDLFPPKVTPLRSQPTRQPKAPIVATYDYVKDGQLRFQVVRRADKTFTQRRPDGHGGWIWNMQGVERCLYHHDDVVASDGPVYIVEGEKDADRLRSLGFNATTVAGGAKAAWLASYTETIVSTGQDVVILHDHDQSGRDCAADRAAALHAAGCTIKIPNLSDVWPEMPEHADISDWLDFGFTGDDLLDFVAVDTPVWSPEPEPVSETIAGHVVLAQVETFLARFVSYPSDHARIAHTLWIAHTHLMDAWESTPRLAFLSPEPSSGKTRALEITELLVPNPVEAVNVTPAYLFRKVGHEDGRPTVLYDEIDTVFGPKAKDNEEIRGLLNAGHRMGAVAGRCVVKGKVIETEEIPAYCAVALAGLGEIPETILSRSVVVRMQRRAAGEHVEGYRRRVHTPEGHAIRDHLATWAKSVQQAVTDAWPAMPNGVEDRDADMWEPLLAVADAADGDWSSQARVAAVALVADSKAGTPSLGIKLLSDIRPLYSQTYVMSTEDILNGLHAMPEAPWGDLKGKPLDARGLARMLGKYKLKSKNVRIRDSVVKGYERGDFEDAWSRYLGPPPDESATSATSATSGGDA